MTKAFTGWHMTGILVGFFGIVIAVNVTMARLASSTFGGALAENGYVASQDYNRWIAAADRQNRFGWSAEVSQKDGRLQIDLKGTSDASASATLIHPLGRSPEQVLALEPVSPTRLVSQQLLPPGRWQAHVTVKVGNQEARYIAEMRG